MNWLIAHPVTLPAAGVAAVAAVIALFARAIRRLDSEDPGSPWNGPKHAAAQQQYDEATVELFTAMNQPPAQPEMAHEPVPFLPAPPVLDTPIHEDHMAGGPPVAGRPVTPAGSGHAHATGGLLPPPLLAGALTCQVIITTAERLLWEAGAAERAAAAAAAELRQLRTQPLETCPWLQEGDGYTVCDQPWPTDSGIMRTITAADTPETVGW